ncbi:hypothetical protein RhiirA4_453697 [Rhizophagus irregularis]|uniref:Uncharacterized protein n=1 Tax=Rhizophagus irregularis TaxID=588596 RepID=A0A2I1G180_9GLOM|nr:hypothetical protein RhiirA4_453697 [Rhizophagus irregularis]
MEKYELRFEIFRNRLCLTSKFSIFKTSLQVFESLSLKGTQRLFVFLHIDEFQLILNGMREEKLFRYIINVLAPEYMFCNGSNLTFVQEFLSGTAKQAVIREKEASKASLVPLKCPMLSTKPMFQITEKCGAEKTSNEYSWKLCNPFLLIIRDTGDYLVHSNLCLIPALKN